MLSPYGIADSGPYPNAGRASELETLSRRALEAALPVGWFRFRDERIEDAGVDGSIELKSNGQSVNLRAQLQLKGTDSTELNQDGSFSLQVKTGNMNYLLNGLSSIYILYIVPRNELRFVWAHDERKRLDSASPRWMEQETVTLRFQNLLDERGLQEIYQRVAREGQMYRRTRETLDRATPTGPVTISYDPITLSQIGPEEAEARLLTDGMAFVASGRSAEVLDLLRVVPRAKGQHPRLQLIQAYAAFHMGRFSNALVHLSEASLRHQELDAENQDFLTFLKDVCEFCTGRIDLTTYSARQQVWEGKRTSGLALSHRLECIRRSLLEQAGEETDDDLLSDLESVVQAILSLPNSHVAFKLHARIAFLYHTGMQDVHTLRREVSDLRMRRRMKRPIDIVPIERLLKENIIGWEVRAENTLKEAWETGNPLVMGDALTMQVTVQVFRALVFRLNWDRDEQGDADDNALLAVSITKAEKALEIYRVVENLDAELRITLLLADLWELMGDASKAKEIATVVVPQAEAMGYQDLATRARQHLSEQTVLARATIRAKQDAEIDPDFRDANLPDENLRAVANNLMRVMALPADRYPVFEREIFTRREIARERLYWCQHIELLQDLRHERHPSTHYLTDPDRHCRCRKYGHETIIGHTDALIVIEAFKDSVCKGCLGRQPKVS